MAGPNIHTKVEDVCQQYPGRASATPTLDVCLTLLSMGKNGYNKLVQDRKKGKFYVGYGWGNVRVNVFLFVIIDVSNKQKLHINLRANVTASLDISY